MIIINYSLVPPHQVILGMVSSSLEKKKGEDERIFTNKKLDFFSTRVYRSGMVKRNNRTIAIRRGFDLNQDNVVPSDHPQETLAVPQEKYRGPLGTANSCTSLHTNGDINTIGIG